MAYQKDERPNRNTVFSCDLCFSIVYAATECYSNITWVFFFFDQSIWRFELWLATIRVIRQMVSTGKNRLTPVFFCWSAHISRIIFATVLFIALHFDTWHINLRVLVQSVSISCEWGYTIDWVVNRIKVMRSTCAIQLWWFLAWLTKEGGLNCCDCDFN